MDRAKAIAEAYKMRREFEQEEAAKLAAAQEKSVGTQDEAGPQEVPQHSQKVIDDSVNTVAYLGTAYGIEVPKEGTTKGFVADVIQLYADRMGAYKKYAEDRIKENGTEVGDKAKIEEEIREGLAQSGTQGVTDKQIDQEVHRRYEQSKIDFAGRRVQGELAAMIAYRHGIVTKSEHIKKAEGPEEERAAGAAYLAHLEETNPAAYDGINKDAEGVIKEFVPAQAVLVSELENGKVLPKPGVSRSEGMEDVVAKVQEAAQNPTDVSRSEGMEGVAQASQAQATKTVTQMVTVQEPDRELSVKVIADNKAVQNIISGAINSINSLDPVSRRMLKIESKLPEMPRTDGQWDAESVTVLNGLLDGLKSGLDLKEKFPDAGYSPELGAAINQALDNNRLMKGVVDGVVFDKDNERQQLVETLNRLDAADELRPVEMIAKQVEQTVEVPVQNVAGTVQPEVVPTQNVAGTVSNISGAGQPGVNPNPNPKVTEPEGTGDNPDAGKTSVGPSVKDVKLATIAVEELLFNVGNNIGELPGAEILDSFGGVKDSVLQTLDKSDLEDGVFGPKSQDLAAKMILTMKTMDGRFKTPDGTYNEDIGRQLKSSILLNPNMAMIREQIKDGDGNSLLPRCLGLDSMGQPLKGNELKHREALIGEMVKYDEELKDPGKEDAGAYKEYQYRMKLRNEIDTNFKKELDGVKELNNVFHSMNILHQSGDLLDNKQASMLTQKNMMMDMAAAALDQFAPGIKTWLKDFFTNSKWGKMIAPMLAMKDMDVSRLWGERTDVSDPKQQMLKGFDDIYGDAAEAAKTKDNPNPTTEQIMDKAQEMAAETMSKGISGFAFTKSMKIMFKDEDENFIKDVVTEALEAAGDAGSKEEARKLFAQSVESAMTAKNLAPNDPKEIIEDAKTIGEEHKKQPGYTPPPASLSAAGQPGVHPRPSRTDLGAGDPTKNYVDAELIEAGKTDVRLTYDPNYEPFPQGPLRLSKGRVQELQEVLAENAEALGLSLKPEGMEIDGKLSDMATQYTCAVIEETLIRAKIHELQAGDKEITQDDLDAFKKELDTKNFGSVLEDNLDNVMAYMEAKGVSEADRAKFKENVEDLAGDYHSTKLAGNPKQDSSVLEQSFFGGQFLLELSQWVPEKKVEAPVEAPKAEAPVEAPKSELEQKYLAHNQGRDCEVPFFYKKEGSESVFATIRNQSGTPGDKSDDKFEELEYRYYQSSNDINDADNEDLQKILENYNWRVSNEDGVRAQINKVLGLGPESLNLDVKIEKPQVSTPVQEKGMSPAEWAAKVSSHDHEAAKPKPAPIPQPAPRSETTEEFNDKSGISSFPITRAVKGFLAGVPFLGKITNSAGSVVAQVEGLRYGWNPEDPSQDVFGSRAEEAEAQRQQEMAQNKGDTTGIKTAQQEQLEAMKRALEETTSAEVQIGVDPYTNPHSGVR